MLKESDKLSRDIKDLLKSKSNDFDKSKIEKLYSNLDNFLIGVVSDKTLSDKLIDCVIKKDFNNELLGKYPIFSEINEFKEFVKNKFKELLLKKLKKDDFNSIAENLLFAIKSDIGNIVLFDYISDLYKEKGLNKELIELYRTAFIVTTDAEYFIKIGDIQDVLGNFEGAINSYLTFAEINGPTKEIYKKLANMFEKVNDEESRLACIEQMNNLEVGNV